MRAADLRELTAYSAWATQRLLRAAAQARTDDLSRSGKGSFPHALATLVHLYGVDRLWLGRATGVATAYPPEGSIPDLATLSSLWLPLLARWQDFAAGWSDGRLDARHHYHNTEGKPHASSLAEIVLQCTNHGTYHRGQVATRLRALGVPPPDTDLIIYFRQGPVRPAGFGAGELRELVAYSAWATQRALAACARLGAAQFTATSGGSFTCMRDLLVHVFGADRTWLGRLTGHVPPWPDARSYAEPAALVHDWQHVLAAWRDFAAGLLDAECERVVAYRNLQGRPFTNSLRQIVQHVVNHATYHRGQITNRLRELDVAPPGTDYVLWCRAGKP